MLKIMTDLKPKIILSNLDINTFMSLIFYSALFGLLGGITRALLGLLKYYRINHRTKFKLSYLFVTILVSGFVGMFVSLVVTSNYALSLVSGYVGIDIIENLVKIYRKKLNV